MFVTQGPVDPESRLFVGRAAELRRMESWLTDVHCVGAVLGARQTGKTSLLLKLRHTLRGKHPSVFIDLSAVAGANLSECLSYIAREMVEQLAAPVPEPDSNTSTHSTWFLGFLTACARAIKDLRIVVMLDEIGALPRETAIRLSGTIRAVFTSRLVKSEFARYVFVISGATDMLELAVGRNSPLRNVTEGLYLEDLSVSETEQLVAAMFDDPTGQVSKEIFRALHPWTEGHPYWTQLLGQALDRSATEPTLPKVRTMVEQLLRTEDRNLPHVFSALEADSALWNLVDPLLGGTPISFTRANSDIAKLELIGILKNGAGRCAIRNRIYREALEKPPVRAPRRPVRDLRQLEQRLREAGDRTMMWQTVVGELQSALQNRSVSIFTKTEDGAFAMTCSLGNPRETPVARFAAGSPLQRIAAEVFDVAHKDLPATAARQLEALGAVLMAPVRLGGEMVALLCLGRKLSNDEYDNEDQEFVKASAEQVAVALDRVRLRELDRDVQKAAEIQRGLLPKDLPELAFAQVSGSCQPMRAVGGDYYDVFDVGSGLTALCIGDVVGKGMPAALLMAKLQGAVRALACSTTTPGRLCEEVHRQIARSTGPGEYITFFYAHFDSRTLRLQYSNAGHNPPMLIRGDAGIVRLVEGGMPLGLAIDAMNRIYLEGEVLLSPGDRLVLFTDGVTEARDEDQEEFGDERLMKVLQDAAALDADGMRRTITDAVTTFSQGHFHDDVTLLILSA